MTNQVSMSTEDCPNFANNMISEVDDYWGMTWKFDPLMEMITTLINLKLISQGIKAHFNIYISNYNFRYFSGRLNNYTTTKRKMPRTWVFIFMGWCSTYWIKFGEWLTGVVDLAFEWNTQKSWRLAFVSKDISLHVFWWY